MSYWDGPFDYWKKFGVPSSERKVQIWNNWNEISRQKALAYQYLDEYKRHNNERFYGGFDGFTQVLTIRDDFELIESILIKDFDNFQRTRYSVYGDTIPVTRTEEIIFKSTTVLHGDEWKEVRNTFGPIFNATDKLELIVSSLRLSNAKLEKLLDQYVADSAIVELKEIFGLYSMDVTTSCVFGVDSEVFSHGNKSPYIQNVRPLLRFDFFHVLRAIISATVNIKFKKFSSAIGLGSLVAYPNQKQFSFFIKIIEESFKIRLKSKIKRNDMISMMIEGMEHDMNPVKKTEPRRFEDNKLFDRGKDLPTSILKRRNTSKCDLKESVESNVLRKPILKRSKSHFDRPEGQSNYREKTSKKLDYDYVIANAAVMLEAGYDVNAIVISFVIHFLAIHPEYQRLLQEELDSHETDNHHVLQNLPYLDAVVNETLRLACLFPVIERVCSKPYRVADTSIIIQKGQLVKINVVGICNDDKYFPDPKQFNPENFIGGDQINRNRTTFIPFSIGPRNCMAKKFALLVIKICLANVVSKFEFTPCSKTEFDYEVDNINYLGGIKGGFWVKCTRRT